MALYLGEAIRVRAQALTPETEHPLDPPPLEAYVSFWRPGDRPDRDPAVRLTPAFGPRAMLYRAETSDFVAYEPTDVAGWEPGRWTYEIRMIGSSFKSFEYGSLTIRP